MKVTQSTANTLQLTRFGLVNCYLVREEDGFTLVDAGLPGGANDILAAAAKAGAPLRRILLTHGHGDHVGAVDALVAQHPATPLSISARDARLLRKDLSLDPGEPQTKIKGSVPGVTTVPATLVSDGELFGSLRCIATPGHTPGHFSFLDERDGTLFAGDALVTMGGELRTAANAPWFFPLPTLATWHKPTAVASAARLLDLPIERVAPGHGNVLPATRGQLSAMVDAARRGSHA